MLPEKLQLCWAWAQLRIRPLLWSSVISYYSSTDCAPHRTRDDRSIYWLALLRMSSIRVGCGWKCKSHEEAQYRNLAY